MHNVREIYQYPPRMMTHSSIAKISATAIATAGLSLLALTHSLQAAPVTYHFTVEVTEGSLAGNTFEGEFTYEDSALTGQGEEVLRVEDGLSASMTMLGQTIAETDDVDYPDYPQLLFSDGEVDRLEFWAESEDRGSWWTLPGWDVTLELQE